MIFLLYLDLALDFTSKTQIMNWLFRFLEFVDNNRVLNREDKILLSLSGGIDSVALTHFLHLAELEFDIAHCNYSLRGEESEKDELFCKQLAAKYNVSFFSKKFNTAEYSKDKGISIQTAARDLRYEWLEEIRQKHNLNVIATAHHLDDNAETMLFNITRGSGFAGIKGIPVVNNFIIRPLLCFQRKEIEAFVKEYNLEYREDSSNVKTEYTRNKIRHNVIPVLREINPEIIKNFANLSDIAKQTEQLIIYILNKEGLLVEKGSEYHIPIEKVNKFPVRETVLYHLLKEFGFSASQTHDIKSTSKTQPGKYFESDNFILIRDRTHYIITPKKNETEAEVVDVDINVTYKLADNLCLHTELIKNTSDFVIPKEKNFAALDYDKLKFPLKLRKWKEGDSFCPYGMIGNKKISDYLIDIKTPLHNKEDVLVLLSGDDIIWVVNHRPDNRYAISPSTRNIFLAKVFNE